METRDIVLALLILSVGVGIFYLLDPTMAGLLKKQDKKHEGFSSDNNDDNEHVIQDAESDAPGVGVPTLNHQSGEYEQYENEKAAYVEPTNIANNSANVEEGFAGDGMYGGKKREEGFDGNAEGFETLNPAPVPLKDAEKPANCYPKDQINPQELLPNDPNSKWAQVNPMGQGDIAGKNYLSAGALIGVNTIGQSMRNANYQLRSDPPNPQVKVSIWNQSTIEPDINRRALEIG
jgi:hypothetical protein